MRSRWWWSGWDERAIQPEVHSRTMVGAGKSSKWRFSRKQPRARKGRSKDNELSLKNTWKLGSVNRARPHPGDWKVGRRQTERSRSRPARRSIIGERCLILSEEHAIKDFTLMSIVTDTA